VGHGCPNTRHEEMALGRAETVERGSRDRVSDVIAKVFRSRADLRLKNEEKNFELNVGGEWKPMKLLCRKRGDVRETGKTSNESIGGIEDSTSQCTEPYQQKSSDNEKRQQYLSSQIIDRVVKRWSFQRIGPTKA